MLVVIKVKLDIIRFKFQIVNYNNNNNQERPKSHSGVQGADDDEIIQTQNGPYLSNSPFDHRATSHTSSVNLLEVVIRITEVTSLHLFTNVVTGIQILVFNTQLQNINFTCISCNLMNQTISMNELDLMPEVFYLDFYQVYCQSNFQIEFSLELVRYLFYRQIESRFNKHTLLEAKLFYIQSYEQSDTGFQI